MCQKHRKKIDKGQRIKILYLIGGLELGGSERQLFLFLKNLDKAHFECYVLVLNPEQDNLRQSIENLGVQVWDVPSNYKGIAKRMWFIYRTILRIRPDVVHSWAFYINPYAGLAGWLACVPVRLGSLRSAFYASGVNMPWLYRFLALYCVSKIIVNSRAAVREMVAYNKRLEQHLIYVPNYLDLEAISDNKISEADLSDMGVGSGQRIVGIVGNLRPEKNHRMFVDAMAPLAEAYPDVQFIIVGQKMSDEPGVAEEIKSRIKELDLGDKFIMMGFRSDVKVILRKMSVVCLTSDYEGTPNVVLEAMLAARPVVATRVGDVPDLVRDGVSGFLVDPGDVPGFTRAVKKLLGAPELGKRMGKSGYQIVLDNFSNQSPKENLTRLYCDSLILKGIYQ
jgi:glycosyltransferase involved in cell wall biosynthesis